MLAHHLSTEEGVLGLSAALGIERATLQLVCQLAALLSQDATKLRVLGDWLESSQWQIDVRPAIRSEFHYAVSIARNLSKHGGLKVIFNPIDAPQLAIDPQTLKRDGLPEGMWERAFLARVSKHYNAGYSGIQDVPCPPHGWSAPFENDLGAANEKLSEAFLLIIAPFYQSLDNTVTDVLAWRAIARSTIKVALAGSPGTLREAGVSEVDPFSGGPLSFKRTSDGFRIWSVGRDHADSSGVSKHESRTDDLVSIVPPLVDDRPLSNAR
jgi:hypothetical protein